ncbi:MAG: type 1 glutamine amidotransferase [Syntrophomonadaceae bacterium]|jgi:CobQ-like glutamine amidotransferase family enzyme
MADFTLAHLYPDLMNLYGDRGNLLCLQQRLAWYGYSCDIKSIGWGQSVNYQDFDLVFMGGGSDREQGVVFRDLIGRADQLWKVISQGMPALFICGAYQLLGTSYRAVNGKLVQGLDFFKFSTYGGQQRLIGDIVLEAEVEGKTITLVGFENHAGRTVFDDPSLSPLGKVIKGFGNNGQDRTEGLRFQNLIATYLHGPLLPKNPALADSIIKAMAERKGLPIIKTLDDTLEKYAHEQVKQKLKK